MGDDQHIDTSHDWSMPNQEVTEGRPSEENEADYQISLFVPSDIKRMKTNMINIKPVMSRTNVQRHICPIRMRQS